MTKTLKIAAIAGDGIGKEVMPEGLRVLEAAARRFDFTLEYHHFEWASCDYYLAHGKMMPDDWKQQLSGMDAIFFGAVGWPDTVPDHISLWGSLLKFRREFDQYINLRPVRLFEGVPCPLANRKPGEIDYYVVRENTEGEYTSLGGIMYENTDREIVIQESVYSRHGANRLLKYAFDLAQSRPRKHVTLATKSNGVAISMPWWDARADDVASPWTSSTSTSWRRASCCSPAVSTWLPPPTCSATSSPTWALQRRAPLVSRHRRTSTPNAPSRASSNPCTALRQTSTGRTSPTRSR